MKTKLEIEFKIMVHENEINKLINDTEMNEDLKSELLNNYLMGRKALLWVLSSDEFIIEDDFEKRVKFEIACIEASKIF